MSDYIAYDGVLSTTLGIVITAAPEITVPERKGKSYSVPGRNGDIIRQQNAWENVEQVYEIAYWDDYPADTAAIAAWLHKGRGYRRLRDTFDASHYRLAYVANEMGTVNMMRTTGTAKLTFVCDPRRFLVSGETETSYSASATVTNPTVFTAKPKVKVYGSGSGTVSVGGNTMQIDSITSGMILDGEAQNATNAAGTANYNQYVTGEWPELSAGANTVSFTGGVTSVTITPNYWEL